MGTEPTNNREQKFLSIIQKLIALSVLLIVIIIIQFGYILFFTQSKINGFFSKPRLSISDSAVNPSAKAEAFWTAPNLIEITDSSKLNLVRYGQDLIAHTALYFGPKGKVKPNATNGMNCQNCHLDAGTKIFGNNYGSVAATYPKYRARSGTIENIFKRVNDCFARSLNGATLDTNSREMKAIAAYIYFLGNEVPKGEKAKGSGLKEMPLLNRPANPKNGAVVYQLKCISCHQKEGQGLMNPEQTMFLYPPLWGAKSYNIGAGLYRLSSLAKYVKYNMPFGVTFKQPMLSDEEAWDVAAFLNSQPHPFKDLKTDWPKIEEKPMDHPFGPFADGFSELQHKYGPFQTIQATLDSIKKKKAAKIASTNK